MTFLYSVFIILATSILTAIFSFWRYRSERWWELKVGTYSKIMESLHYIKKCNDMYYDSNWKSMYPEDHDEDMIERKMEQEEIEILIKKSTSAQEEIKKIIDVSSFIIDQQALDELIKLEWLHLKKNLGCEIELIKVSANTYSIY